MGQTRSGRRVDVQRLIQRHRRGLAAVLAAGSVVALWAALKPPATPVRPVVVAAGHLVPGQRLGPEDLTIVEVAAGLLPADAADDPGDLSGQVVASAIGRGEPVTRSRLLAPANLAAPPGRAIIPVRFEDAAATGLLSEGQRIQVVAAGGLVDDTGAAPQVLATDALVLAVLARGVAPPVRGSGSEAESDQRGPRDSWLSGGTALGSGGDGALTILAVSPEEGMAIAGAQGDHRLGYMWGPS